MPSTAQTWFQRLAPYRTAQDGRAVFELLITLIPFSALWAGIWGLMQAGHYWAIIGFIPAGGLIVRLFIIQHEIVDIRQEMHLELYVLVKEIFARL